MKSVFSVIINDVRECVKTIGKSLKFLFIEFSSVFRLSKTRSAMNVNTNYRVILVYMITMFICISFDYPLEYIVYSIFFILILHYLEDVYIRSREA